MNTTLLNPLDYIFTGPGSHPITFAVFYPHQYSDKKLRQTLAETTASFPLLHSRLVALSEQDYAFAPDEAGLVYDTVQMPARIEEIDDMVSLVTPVQSVPGAALTHIQHTELKNGSALGVSISHALVDGFSYFHFFSSWARTARGQRILPPAGERTWLEAAPTLPAHPLSAAEVLQKCGLFYGKRRTPLPPESLQETRRHISKSEIRKWQAQAKESLGTALSDNDVITAFLWQHFGLAWAPDDGEAEIYLTCPVDYRRLLREMPRTYFGQALAFTTTSLPRRELEQASIAALGARVNAAVRRVRAAYVRAALQTLAALRRQAGAAALEKIQIRHPHAGLIVSNISRLPLHDLDFGLGPPIRFLAASEISRGAAVLPSVKDGVEVLAYPPVNAQNALSNA